MIDALARTPLAIAALIVAAGVTGAVARTAQAPRAGSIAGVTFTRVVAPFPVADQAGRPFALPFLGGFDVPRPQFIDIDGDGDLDLFIQEYSNTLAFFENTGSAKAPAYVWRSDAYQNLAVGEWYRFIDLDADGRIDLVSEEPFSHVRLYRNTGSRTQPAFESSGQLLDPEGQPVFFDRQNIPAFVDLDCDKRLDLFVGRVDGTVARLEAEQPGSVKFGLIEERFEGIEIVARIGFGMPPTMHGANALAFADYDADGDADLFWGDFFEAGVLLIENIGRTCSTPSFQVEPVLLPLDAIRTSGYNAPVPVDVDADGDLDFLMGVLGGAFNPIATAADNFYYWERAAKDRFELRTKRFLDGLDLGNDTVPALVDLDADGDLDLVVGNKIDPAAGDSGRLAFFTNEGTKTAPAYRLKTSLPMADAFHLAPAFGDLDGDGDPDMLLGTWNRDVLFFRNQGTAKEARWVQDEAASIKPPRVSQASPVLGDIDADGDLDLFIGQASGAIVFYRNDGTPKAPKFVLVSEAIDGIRVGRRSAPALVDVDDDGRLDLVVGREDRGAVAYRHAGTATSPKFVLFEKVTLALPPMSSPRFADLDGDGVVDLVSGTVSGGLVFLKGQK